MSAEQTYALYDDLLGALDRRTLEVVERQRAASRPRRRGWLVRRALVGADAGGLFFAFLIAQALVHNPSASTDRIGADAEWALFVLTLPLWILVAKIYGLYDRDEERTDHSTVDDVVGVFHLVTIGAWLFYAGAWFTGVAAPDIPKLITFWFLANLFVCIGRATARALCRRSVLYLQNTIIVGAGDVGQTIARKILNHPEYGLNVVGFVDADAAQPSGDIGHVTLLGGCERLPQLVRLLDVERVIIGFANDSPTEMVGVIRSLKGLDVQIDIVPRFYELVGPNIGFHSVEGVPLLGLPPLNLSRSSRLLKRGLDVVLAGAGLVLLAPVLVVAAAAIKLDSPGPVFFRQIRMGRDGTFRIWKLRTMVADADRRRHEVAHLNKHLVNGGDSRMFKAANDPRITRVGSFLRRYSLDELPQLLNVLRGEMTLVGPRPLILSEDRHVVGWGRDRLNLKPGCTGPWQVYGRTDIPFEEMVRLDHLYVTGWSLTNDFRLICRTLPALVRSSDAF